MHTLVRQNSFRSRAVFLTASLLPGSGLIPAPAAEPPRLVLQITVDALRGDLPGPYAQLSNQDISNQPQPV